MHQDGPASIREASSIVITPVAASPLMMARLCAAPRPAAASRNVEGRAGEGGSQWDFSP
jgi:hypothetical protein